jgi:hypothetical protein
MTDKLNKIIHTLPIDVEWLYSYVIDLCKNGFLLKKMEIKTRRESCHKNSGWEKKFT